MARKRQSAISRFARNVLLLVVAAIAAAIAYKQVVLVSRLTANFPEDQLAQSIALCVQEHMTPNLIKSLQPVNSNSSLGSALDMIWQRVSDKVVKIEIQAHYLTELKVLQMDDYVGQNARMRATGAVDMALKLPLIGQVAGKQDYLTEVMKRGGAYYFETLSVKGTEDTAWEEWPCSKELGSK